MSINMNDKKNIQTDTEACYETVASQEEIYLEETEEDLRAILIFSDPCPSPSDTDEQIDDAAEELITGDSDDPPLSDEEVVEILDDSHAQRLKSVS
jgi:hypothetical protein